MTDSKAASSVKRFHTRDPLSLLATAQVEVVLASEYDAVVAALREKECGSFTVRGCVDNGHCICGARAALQRQGGSDE